MKLVLQSVIDLITVGAFMVIFVIIFVLYISVKKNESNIKKIIRRVALEKK